MPSKDLDAIDHVALARGLVPMLNAASASIERERKIPADVLEALHAASMFRLALPRSVGGVELDLPSLVKVVEALGHGDASVAWCVSQAAGCATAAAYLAPDVAQEIFGDRQAVTSWGPPIGAGAKAIAVEGGYRLTGTWQFVSGAPHATWIGATNCTICDPNGKPRLDAKGTPVARRVMLFPKAKAVFTDIWDVIGLRGTGSDNYTVTDLFVPEAYSFALDSAVDRREAGPLYRFSTLSFFGYVFAGVALGIARAALDDFIRLASEKVPYRFSSTLRENATVQSQVAIADAKLRAARLFLMHSLDEIWDAVVKTGELTVDQRLTLRLATTHTIREAKDVVAIVYEFAGSTAIFADHPFERRFRDIHAMTQHLQARFTNYETVGQALLGLSPGAFI